MAETVNVYWANVPEGPLDWSIAFEEPKKLISELSLNRNRNNPDNNLLRCPAVTDLMKNLFIIKNPLPTSASFIIEDGSVSSSMNSSDGKWVVNRPPNINGQLLASYSHPLIFFSEENLDIMLSEPYFSQAQHKSWGSIVPGIFNCGSWFRPVQMEFNVWQGNTNLSLEENEPIAYVKFFTDKNVVLKRFTMTQELVNQATACSSAGQWEPRVPLLKRYTRFKNSKRDKFVLKIIKENMV